MQSLACPIDKGGPEAPNVQGGMQARMNSWSAASAVVQRTFTASRRKAANVLRKSSKRSDDPECGATRSAFEFMPNRILAPLSACKPHSSRHSQ